MNEGRERIIRVVISLAVGLSLCAFGLMASWGNGAGNPALVPRQDRTWGVLVDIAHAMENYAQRNEGLPDSLAALYRVNGSAPEPLANGDVLDGWGRPVLFEVRGDTWSVHTLGRDGRPGGVGLDHDLTGREAEDYACQSEPTFLQFLAEGPTERVLAVAGMAALLGFVLCLALLREVRFTALDDFVKLAFVLAATGFVTALVTSFIAALHFSGH